MFSICGRHADSAATGWQECGAEGFLVEHQRDLEWTLRRAKEAAAAGRPALVNVWLDKTDFREGSISM